MTIRTSLWQSELPGLPPPRRGKVRDVYDLGDTLLIVASDRLSAYDHVLRPGIPGKGKILNQLSNFWFQRLSAIVPNHLLATDPGGLPRRARPLPGPLRGRSVLARKARVVPFECVARGFLAGSGYREYVQTAHRLRHPPPPGPAAGEPAPRADLHPGDQGRGGARRERRLRRPSSAPWGRSSPPSCATSPSPSIGRGAEHADRAQPDPRRHQVRVRPCCRHR